jgi:hypothetical protein
MRCFPSFAFCKAFYNNLVSVWMSVRVVAIENESVFVECVYSFISVIYTPDWVAGGKEKGSVGIVCPFLFFFYFLVVV